MRLVFLTSGLEPGRDGVGDYTTLLAETCRRKGCETLLIALNDGFVRGIVENEATVRCGPDVSWEERVRVIRERVQNFAPDWVSIQFVCYGFHAKGFAWKAADRLRRMIGDRKVHLFFHELWLGAERDAPLRDWAAGILQRLGVQRLFAKLDVSVVQTSNAGYLAVLRQHGVKATCLPLFGSVPLPLEDAMPADDGWTFGMFGTLHPVWPPRPLLDLLQATGKRIRIEHAGHMGSGENLWQRMGAQWPGIEFHAHGPQPSGELARIFSRWNFGIATTPWEIIGKSASVAALLDHGLPVIVNRDDAHYHGWREEDYHPLLIKMSLDLGAKLDGLKRQQPDLLRPTITERFLAALACVR